MERQPVERSDPKARLELRALLENRLVEAGDAAAAAGVLADAMMGYLATSAGSWPYILPLAFAAHEDVIYFHSGQGLMASMLADDPHVCLLVMTQPLFEPASTACEYTFRYESVLAFGDAILLESDQEREQALRLIVAKYDAAARDAAFKPSSFASTLVFRMDVEALTYKRAPEA